MKVIVNRLTDAELSYLGPAIAAEISKRQKGAKKQPTNKELRQLYLDNLQDFVKEHVRQGGWYVNVLPQYMLYILEEWHAGSSWEAETRQVPFHSFYMDSFARGYNHYNDSTELCMKNIYGDEAVFNATEEGWVSDSPDRVFLLVGGTKRPGSGEWHGDQDEDQDDKWDLEMEKKLRLADYKHIRKLAHSLKLI